MTEATNGQKTIAHTLLNLQTAYSSTFGSDVPDDEKNAQLNDIAGKYADALVQFLSTPNGGTHVLS
ncbi:hypothetical protein E4V99_14050 [Microbacterium sp. dk485]|uniref:hypothetical protein n=1 Tax=Microbacterium sp. dk485 TaxID=2560021 RepID=UPI00107387B3|nr:hypothetical protein [Microbacterium sp. dk485]TFV82052.1 hypothetical protein E4V99_14050 [Microbacterium sp. dk485]